MKNGSGKFWLFLRVGALNFAVAIMFISVNQTVPQAVVLNNFMPIYMEPKPQEKTIKIGIPNRLVISSLDMDLAVGVGSFDKMSGSWTIDATKVFYADASTKTNDTRGTTLIYGHAQWPIFGNLHSIEPQSKAYVDTNNGYRFHYVYQSMKQVSPTDVSVFRNDGNPTLVLQTCSGAWDAYRSLFSFKLVSVKKI
ncbi:MAG: sortase [Candidatus Saccharimonadales bacterium]